MSDQFLGEIRVFSFNFAPLGWAICQGQILAISQNTALFSLLGTNYGGNGTSTFGLPNFQGFFPVGTGSGPGRSQYFTGQTSGAPNVTLLPAEIPAHTHTMSAANSAGTTNSPAGTAPAQAFLRSQSLFGSDTVTAAMAPAAIPAVGGNGAHNNMPPYVALNYCIALQGIFPPRG